VNLLEDIKVCFCLTSYLFLSHSLQIQSNLVNGFDASIILNDAKAFSSPQDLRYAVFACQAAILCPSTLAQHLSSLKKRAIVQVIDQYHIRLTTPSRVSLSLAIHYCYPQV
jgi:hypothetical protein